MIQFVSLLGVLASFCLAALLTIPIAIKYNQTWRCFAMFILFICTAIGFIWVYLTMIEPYFIVKDITYQQVCSEQKIVTERWK